MSEGLGTIRIEVQYGSLLLVYVKLAGFRMLGGQAQVGDLTERRFSTIRQGALQGKGAAEATATPDE